MKEPKNKNYCATVVEIKNLIPLLNCDNVQGTSIFGFQAIVGKDVQIGDVGLFFPVETQLSQKYLKENNLYRHSDLNNDQTKKGYFEDNGRVRAVKFRGHVSNGIFMPMNSLDFIGVYPELGREFDELNDIEICRKYEVPIKGGLRSANYKPKKESRVSSINFPEHVSTAQLLKYIQNIDPETEMIITQKLHGTSIRIANTYVKNRLTLKDRIAKYFGVQVQEMTTDYVYGSRKVTKDVNDPEQNHFYEYDVWTDEGMKLDGLLPEGYIVFAELVGKLKSGKAIQTHYTYGFDEPKLYVYRIAIVNEKGYMQDLTWEQVKVFCTDRGLNFVPEFGKVKVKDFNWEEYKDKRYADDKLKFPSAISLGIDDIVDEGIVARIETGNTPVFYKAKSPIFYDHETALLDAGASDLESEQSITYDPAKEI